MQAKWLKFSGPLLVIALGVGVAALLKATAPAPQTEEAAPRPVTVYTHLAKRTDTVLDIETQGEVRARTMINLTAQVSGRVVAVSSEYTEGGRFSSDTVLMRIDDSDYQLALREAEASVAAAELGVQQALADADVAEKQLRNQSKVSDLALKKPQIAEARARLEAALASVELARLNLDRTAVKLPFDGRVTSTTVHVGEVINLGSPLGEVFATDQVRVRLPLTNQQLSALGLPIGFSAEQGQGSPVDFSAEVAGVRQHWQGELVRIDASIDPETRLIYATAELDDPYNSNRSAEGMPMAVGLFVDARIKGRQLRDAVQIPSRGLRAGDQLFVVDSEGILEIRTATVAFSNSDHAVITRGLRPGERLIVSALRSPISGMAVTTIDESSIAGRTN